MKTGKEKKRRFVIYQNRVTGAILVTVKRNEAHCTKMWFTKDDIDAGNKHNLEIVHNRNDYVRLEVESHGVAIHQVHDLVAFDDEYNDCTEDDR